MTIHQQKANGIVPPKKRINKLGYVILNGQKAKNFWNAKIYAPKQPLRLKIRNICGDETIFVF